MADFGALAQQHLRGPSTRFPPYRFSPMFRRALGQCGYGLHHLLGEEVLAIVNHSQTREEFMGVIVTSYAVLARFGQERVHVDFDDLQAAELHEGFFSTVVRLQTRRDEVEIPLLRDQAAVAHFLGAVAGQRQVKRRLPPAFVPNPDDPACIDAFIASLDQDDDPRFAAMAGRARQELDDGKDEAAVRDTIARLYLLRLQTTRGRGMEEGRFVSPLPEGALALISNELLPTVAEAEDLIPNPTEVRERVQSAIVEKAVGAAVSKAFGVEVDLEDILGDDEIIARRIRVEDGPATHSVVGAGTDVGSAWATLKNLAARALGDSAGSGSFSTFCLEAKTGRRWRELALREPDAVFQILQDIEQREWEALSGER
jgi:hypothetical protein